MIDMGFAKRWLWLSMVLTADSDGICNCSAKVLQSVCRGPTKALQRTFIDSTVDLFQQKKMIEIFNGEDGTKYCRLLNWKKYQKLKYGEHQPRKISSIKKTEDPHLKRREEKRRDEKCAVALDGRLEPPIATASKQKPDPPPAADPPTAAEASIAGNGAANQAVRLPEKNDQDRTSAYQGSDRVRDFLAEVKGAEENP